MLWLIRLLVILLRLSILGSILLLAILSLMPILSILCRLLLLLLRLLSLLLPHPLIFLIRLLHNLPGLRNHIAKSAHRYISPAKRKSPLCLSVVQYSRLIRQVDLQNRWRPVKRRKTSHHRRWKREAAALF